MLSLPTPLVGTALNYAPNNGYEGDKERQEIGITFKIVFFEMKSHSLSVIGNADPPYSMITLLFHNLKSFDENSVNW